MRETLAELPFIGDQVVCLSHEPGRPQRNAIRRRGWTQSVSLHSTGILTLGGSYACAFAIEADLWTIAHCVIWFRR